MKSVDILTDFFADEINYVEAVTELKKYGNRPITLEERLEAARSFYAIGLVERIHQYETGKASEFDLCLCIRDVLLVFGRLRFNVEICRVAKIYGTSFGLQDEGNLELSCQMKVPDWLEPKQYVNDVYGFAHNSECEEMGSHGDALLRKLTHFNNYRSFEQKSTIHTALRAPEGSTLLVSQPTGAGKSTITRMLAATSTGLTIVIVPTVALALDQFFAAKHSLRDGSDIYCYRGDQDQKEKGEIIQSLKKRKARMLFTSPEAVIRNNEIKNILETMAQEGSITNVVVDEAHIVPDWGVFFRPDFQILSIILKKWRKLSPHSIRVFLLSATLSDDVVETLFNLFGSESHNIQIRCDSLRIEPRFYYYAVKSRDEQFKRISEALVYLPKPMVIYVLEPREAEALRKKICGLGYKNVPVFSGETKDEDRERILTGWKGHKFDIVVATSAFGIGVDKPDVRTVIHACCPENLSRYYQEVGRGGRDGFPSLSLFMPCRGHYKEENDIEKAAGLVKKRVLTVELLVKRWLSMLHASNTIFTGDTCIVDTSTTHSGMTELEAEYAGSLNVAWNVNLLLFLHRNKFIRLVDADYVYENKTYMVQIELLRPDVLDDAPKMQEAITELRDKEYREQVEGYELIKKVSDAPRSRCWGKVFKQLFPLSDEVCNGCPADPTGRITVGDTFKVRNIPVLVLPSVNPCTRLARKLSSYSDLAVLRSNNGVLTAEELQQLCVRANENRLGALVIPDFVKDNLDFNGIVMTYSEFHFSAHRMPYLFSDGVLCVMSDDILNNAELLKDMNVLKKSGYTRVLYCNANTVGSTNGKKIVDLIEGYAITQERF